ncbi:MAG: FKBP-type peptidyl-prolyl cis-trans isomerase [Longimicrobiales bacterium]
MERIGRWARVRALTTALAVLVVPAMACSSDAFAPQVIEDLTFFPGLGIDLNAMTKLPSGVYIQDDSVGTGTVLGSDTVDVQIDHRGWLADGTLFSSGVFPFEYPTGVISGFAIGMEGMAVGGQRLMIIPSALAYGNSGTGPIPPGAVLIFEVELLDVF